MVRLRLILFLAVFLFCAVLAAKHLELYNDGATAREPIGSVGFSAVRALRPGVMKLFGRVDSVNSVEGPFSGESCAFYEITVERRTLGFWSTLLQKASIERPVVLRDGTGVVPVQMPGMQVFTGNALVTETSSRQAPTERIKRYFDLNAQEKLFAWDQNLRFTEKCLKTEDYFYVLGTASIIPGTARQLEMRKVGNGPGVVANMPEKMLVAAIETKSHRSGILGVFLSGVSVIALGVALLLYRKK